ncbi:hypothetical protein AVEN_241201-1 [Araneus ventricosus]|uniref:Uncharacterized protein n=1 Tax=Araneus ventricosus TaxID=182803 RepID=A0A4Y2CZN5_ARAVE|nr:hypothetical protein AVEN_241201-1 [Araneus ventricosus]
MYSGIQTHIIFISSNELSLQHLDDVILELAVLSLFHTDTELIQKPSNSLTKDIIDTKNIYSEHESNETLSRVTFPKNDSQSIHVLGKRSLSEDNVNDLHEVPNYGKRKTEEPEKMTSL